MAKNNYSPTFKAKVVLEVLQEEQKLIAIASKYNLNPNMLRNWKLVPSGIVMSAPFSQIRMATSEEIALGSVTGFDTVLGTVSAPICTKGTGAIACESGTV